MATGNQVFGMQAVASPDFVHGLEQMAENRENKIAEINAKNRERREETNAKLEEYNLKLQQPKWDKLLPMYQDKAEDVANQGLGKMLDEYSHRRSDVDFGVEASKITNEVGKNLDALYKSSASIGALINTPTEASNPELEMAKQAYQQYGSSSDEFEKALARVPNALNSWNYDANTKMFSFKPTQNIDVEKWSTEATKNIPLTEPSIIAEDKERGYVTYLNTASPEEIDKRAQLQYQTNPAGSSSPLWNKFIHDNYSKYVQPVKGGKYGEDITGYKINMEEATPAYQEWIKQELNKSEGTKSLTTTKPINDPDKKFQYAVRLYKAKESIGGNVKDWKYDTVKGEIDKAASKIESQIKAQGSITYFGKEYKDPKELQEAMQDDLNTLVQARKDKESGKISDDDYTKKAQDILGALQILGIEDTGGVTHTSTGGDDFSSYKVKNLHIPNK